MLKNKANKKCRRLNYFLVPVLTLCFIIIFELRLPAQQNNREYVAQACTGSLGDAILYETFGNGIGYGVAITPGYTTLGYQPATCPFDGNYAIVNYTSGCWPNDVVWHSTGDHTGDGNGYFMLVNASYTPSDFYTRQVDNLCEGTAYQFSAWLLNMCSVTGTLPNITFTIETAAGAILVKKNTGDVPITNPAAWRQDTLNFTTPPGVFSVVLRMRNNAPGGVGNDVGLDDISFSPIGPRTTVSAQGVAGSVVRVCNRSVPLTATVETCYLSDSYQWQSSQDSINWMNITGETKLLYTAPSNNSDDTVYYRLLVAQQGNIDVKTCRVNSNTIMVISGVLIAPASADTSVTICNGGSYKLPSGKEVNQAGIYKDTVENRFGCDSLVTTLNLALFIPVNTSVKATVCGPANYVLPSGKTVNASGIYKDTLYKTDGCDSLITTLNLTIITATVNHLKVNICPGTGYLLPSGKMVSAAGLYYDTVQSSIGCDSIVTTVSIDFVNAVYKDITAVICSGQDYTMPSGKTINSQGIYYDTLRSERGCDSLIFHISVTVSASDALLNGFLLPNAFTPNSDGLNDCFGIKKWGAVTNLHFAVYNRWGQRMFYASGATDCWDGTYKGQLQPQASYVYYISALTACGQLSRRGVVVLMR